MKKFTVKITSFILLVCCAFAAVSLSGCSDNSNNKLNDKIVGKWERYWSTDPVSNPFGGDPIVIKGKNIVRFDDAGNYTSTEYDSDTDEISLTQTGTYLIEGDNTLKITLEDSRLFTFDYDESAKNSNNGKWFLSGDKLYLVYPGAEEKVEYDRM